jgi:hypothetical protein
MERPKYIAQGYNRVKMVKNLAELFEAQFDKDTNVILLPRRLSGHFNAVAKRLAKAEPETTFSLFKTFNYKHACTLLKGFRGEAKKAAECILNDMRTLHEQGVGNLDLRVITTDYQDLFHTDGTKDEFGRALCCYTVAATEAVQNYASRNWCDLYKPDSKTQTFSFKLGDIWRHAGDRSRPGVPPFIHRAPNKKPISKVNPRMLLVANK